VANSWEANPGLPLKDRLIRHFAIRNVERIGLSSVGSVEQLKLWVRLLELDRVGACPSVLFPFSPSLVANQSRFL
jgi:hypothetical protein